MRVLSGADLNDSCPWFGICGMDVLSEADSNDSCPWFGICGIPLGAPFYDMSLIIHHTSLDLSSFNPLCVMKSDRYTSPMCGCMFYTHFNM